MKRYNILNRYIQGTNVSPQTSHVLNNMWKNREKMTPEARVLFDTWAEHYEVEIDLQGGYHAHLEELYSMLVKLEDVPSAKFNESQEALCGSCTVVSFVASERIVAANNYIRFQRVPLNKVHTLANLTYAELDIESDTPEASAKLREEEIYVASYISRLSLL